jgi:uncharacterized protein
MSLGIGLIFTLQNRPQRVLNPHVLATIAGGSSTAVVPTVARKRAALVPGLRQALKLARGEFFDMGRYLIIGVSLASAMQTFIGQDQLKTFARDPVLSVLGMAALAFVLSLCSTTDAILALSFANPLSGLRFTTGSILVFLTFGPMVDVKSTMLYLSVFRRKAVFYLVILPLLISVLIGVWLNLNVRF